MKRLLARISWVHLHRTQGSFCMTILRLTSAS